MDPQDIRSRAPAWPLIALLSLFLIALFPSASAAECQSWWDQCGGISWVGETCCQRGAACIVQNEWYSQCVPSNPAETTCAQKYAQCGGEGYSGPTGCCSRGWACVEHSPMYSQCVFAPGANIVVPPPVSPPAAEYSPTVAPDTTQAVPTPDAPADPTFSADVVGQGAIIPIPTANAAAKAPPPPPPVQPAPPKQQPPPP
ncbi:hypothetical protein M427DRAFT_67265, partial [Gonapodya prolifera JEL478]